MEKLKAWFNASFRRAPVLAETPTMSDADRGVIVGFAAGVDELRQKAIEIHRANIATLGVRGDIYQCFMAEVDNPVPDYALRHAYREAVLSAANSN